MNKLARVLRHFDHVIDTQVMLSVEPLRHKAEITMRLRGKDIHCEAVDENLYAAIDLLADKIDRQVLKHNDQVQSHTAESVKRQAAAATQQTTHSRESSPPRPCTTPRLNPAIPSTGLAKH